MSSPATPPSGPVEWLATYGDSSATVWARSWFEARRRAAMMMGAPTEEVDPRQVVRVVMNGASK